MTCSKCMKVPRALALAPALAHQEGEPCRGVCCCMLGKQGTITAKLPHQHGEEYLCRMSVHGQEAHVGQYWAVETGAHDRLLREEGYKTGPDWTGVSGTIRNDAARDREARGLPRPAEGQPAIRAMQALLMVAYRSKAR